MREYVGAISGGALGYISGGPWGAFIGGKLGYYGGKFFTPNSKMERGRSRVRGLTPVRVRWRSTSDERKWKRYNLRAIGRQTRSWSRGRSLKRKLKLRRSYKSGYRRMKGGGLRTPVVKYPKRSKTSFRRRRVKISKKFRRKVLKVVTGSKHKGFFMWNTYTAGVLQSHRQTVIRPTEIIVYDGQNTDEIVPNPGTHPIFSPTVFAAAAEVLFGPRVGPTNNSAIWNIPVGCMGGNDAIAVNARIPVINSWARYCLKNNSNIGMEVKMFICKPRVNSFMYHGMNPAGQSPDVFYLYDPIKDWEKAQGDLYADAVNSFGILTQKQTLKGVLQTDGISTMDVDPRMFTWWNKKWKADVIKMKISPGQCIEKIVKGPSDFVVDMFKLFRGANENNANKADAALRPGGWTFEEIQKYNRYVFFIVKPEISAASTQLLDGSPVVYGAGRYFNPNSLKEGQTFLVENRLFYKIGLPEKFGRQNESAYNPDWLVENQQRDTFFCQYQKYAQAAGTGSIWVNTQNAGVTSFTETQ